MLHVSSCAQNYTCIICQGLFDTPPLYSQTCVYVVRKYNEGELQLVLSRKLDVYHKIKKMFTNTIIVITEVY